ncbi:MAG TPA: PPOX class F420-dependent oxidoreductase [Gammaproteobacteria bacterium]|nr:PPOX class F420-dependent oxidoreductase [Gammaproteobacteria bacterium]
MQPTSTLPGDGPEPGAQALAEAPYLSLVTWRRSGRPVATPVWCALDRDEFFIFSAGDAGKVKRIRAGSAAAVAICDVRGRVSSGYVRGTARILSSQADITRALTALRRKYGWQMLVADLLSRCTGRFARRAYLAVRLGSEPL